MGVHASWQNEERTIVTLEFVGSWNWDEYHSALVDLDTMLSSITYKADMIVDFTESAGMPNGALTQLRDRFKKPNPNRGTVLIVGANRLLQTLGSLLESMFPTATKNMKFMSTVDEAVAYLNDPR